MTSFNPTGVSIPQIFRKKQGNSSTFKQTPVDRLVEVEKVEPDIAGNGKLIVVEHTPRGVRRYQVSVEAGTRERMKNNANVQTATRKWSGGLIDEKFAQEIIPGTMLILIRCMSTGPKKVVNGEEIYFIETNWVRRAPVKAFTGVFTIASFRGRVSSVQHWGDAISFNDGDGLTKLADELDSLIEKREAGEYMPSVGVQMYAMIPDQIDESGTVLDYVVLDTTPPFDWQSGGVDENGVAQKGHPLSGDKLEQLIQGYQDYLLGDESKGMPAKFSDDILEKLEIELQVYTNYNASSMSDDLVIPEGNTRHPLHRMTNTPSKYAMEDTAYVTSKNWAVAGILTLTNDKVEIDQKSRQSTFTNRDLATRLFANGAMGNVLSFIRTANGTKKKPHADLKVNLNEDSAAAQQPSQQSSSERSEKPTSNGSVSAPPVDKVKEKEEDFSLLNSSGADNIYSSSFDDIPFGDDPFNKVDVPEVKAKEDDAPFNTTEDDKDSGGDAAGKRKFGRRTI